MKFRFLTDEFFKVYSNCQEMERKNNRPYAHLCIVEMDNLKFAIPIRHHITHNYAIFTDKEKTKGLDLSKTVIIVDDKYIDYSKIAYISAEEYNLLVNKKYYIKEKLKSYIKTYKKALKHKDIPRNKSLCEKSTLQYFHKELGI